MRLEGATDPDRSLRDLPLDLIERDVRVPPLELDPEKRKRKTVTTFLFRAK
jgi:hypothetical protein